MSENPSEYVYNKVRLKDMSRDELERSFVEFATFVSQRLHVASFQIFSACPFEDPAGEFAVFSSVDERDATVAEDIAERDRNRREFDDKRRAEAQAAIELLRRDHGNNSAVMRGCDWVEQRIGAN